MTIRFLYFWKDERRHQVYRWSAVPRVGEEVQLPMEDSITHGAVLWSFVVDKVTYMPKMTPWASAGDATSAADLFEVFVDVDLSRKSPGENP